MEWIFIIIISMALLILLLYYIGGKLKNVQTIVDLKEAISLLLNKGIEGSFLIINEKKSKLWIQIHKHFDDDGYAGIEIAFPDAEWSKPYYKHLIDRLFDINIQYIEEVGGSDMNFIFIDCSNDIEKAYNMSKDIFINIFHLSPDAEFEIKGTGIIPFGKDILHIDRHPKTVRDIFKK